MLPANHAFLVSCFSLLAVDGIAYAEPLEPIRVSEDRTHFVRGADGQRFVIWGVNYDHDSEGRLLEEYWTDEWNAVEKDFREIRDLGANCVRIHLQLGLFMDTPTTPNRAALQQLAKLVALAESTGLYLDVTGLACYHKKHIPPWYDALDEQARWAVQARFWEAVAEVCRDSPAIFCYDLMNEPILPGQAKETEWLGGELDGKFFVQRLALDLQDRTREAVASAWIEAMATAIRKHDKTHLITVGVIPWVFHFQGGEPLFYKLPASKHLDFVAVHFYPNRGEIDQALAALDRYELGKPLVIEEMFPLQCSADELVTFVRRSARHADGWISFYWGKTAEELLDGEEVSIGEAITADWLKRFEDLGGEMKAGPQKTSPPPP